MWQDNCQATAGKTHVHRAVLACLVCSKSEVIIIVCSALVWGLGDQLLLSPLPCVTTHLTFDLLIMSSKSLWQVSLSIDSILAKFERPLQAWRSSVVFAYQARVWGTSHYHCILSAVHNICVLPSANGGFLRMRFAPLTFDGYYRTAEHRTVSVIVTS